VNNLKVLILSSTPWDDNNSFGNSYSNLFEDIDGIEIANIYCRSGKPNNNIVKKYYQMTEKTLISNLKNKNVPSGKEISIDLSSASSLSDKEQKTFDSVRKRRMQIFLWARELIWKIGRWKSAELKEFIDDFNPDLIFQPIYFSSHLCDISLFIKKHTGKPMIGYVSDDCYTLRQFNLSPLYWINRLSVRRKVKKVIDKCELLYVISDIQKREYEKIFNKECKVLTKCADFSASAPVKNEYNEPLKLVYTGNLGAGRWKSISLISQAVEKVNDEKKLLSFDIYSATPLTEKMKKSFSHNGTSFKGAVSSSEIPLIQGDADILVHAEGLDLKSRLQVHQSFSTKIVDYLKTARTILAVGTGDEASIDYLIKNECAVVCENYNDIYYNLLELISDKKLLDDFSLAAYYRGQFNHSSEKMKSMLLNDMKRICNND